MPCLHLVANRCINSQAMPRSGIYPTAESCAKCEYYEGPPRGLGDVVETVARATGVKQAVAFVSGGGKGCSGCQKRREALNQAVPFQKSTQAP